MARVLVTGFCSLPGPDRAGVQLRHIVDALSARHQIDVLTLRREDQAYVERVRQARILRVPMNASERTKRIEAFQRALRRQLEGAEYDIVHFRDAWSGKVVLENQQRGGYVTVFDAARSPMAESSFRDHSSEHLLERLCAQRSDMVLAPSNMGADALARISSADKVHVVPPGVNVDAFDWEHPPTSGPPVILYLGTLTKGRGLQILLRAMFEIAKRSEAVLVLAGPGDKAFRETMQRSVDELELGERVRLLGDISHDLAPAIIGRATVCVAPAAAEVESRATVLYPTKLLEYMACKRPIVAPHRSSVTMLLRHEQNALLFKPGSPEDLAEQVLRLLRNVDLRDSLAQNGYDLVRVAATASNTRRALRKAYRWLLERDDIRHRLEASQSDEYRPESITDLAVMLDISTPHSGSSLGEDTVIVGEGGSQDEGGDVTRVEMNPFLAIQEREAARDAEDPNDREDGGEDQDTGKRAPVDEPTTSELEVIEDIVVVEEEDVDTGRIRGGSESDAKSWPSFDDPEESEKTGTDTEAIPLAAQKTPPRRGPVPFDRPLVAGEVKAKKARPELSKPIEHQTAVRVSPILAPKPPKVPNVPKAPERPKPAQAIAKPKPPKVPPKRRASSSDEPSTPRSRKNLHEEPTVQLARIRDLPTPGKADKS